MTLTQIFTVHDRKHAGLLLAEKLSQFKNSGAIVIAVPNGGAVVGYHLATELHLPFDVVPCKKINHPGDNKKTIGSISADEVVIHGETYGIPRDYIYHQIVLNQNALKAQRAFYNLSQAQLKVKDKTVIVVGDVLTSADSLMASLKSIRKQRPKEIVVAASVATPEAVSELSCEADEIAMLAVGNNIKPENFYEEYPRIKDEEVRDLIIKARNKLNQG